jgi:hypothetical protein
VILDERGRYRAQQVSYLKASQVFEHKPKPSAESAKRWTAMQIGIVIYIVFMGLRALVNYYRLILYCSSV